MAGKIFISYRREDEIGYAARLYESLSDTFGQDSLFFDIDSIPPGFDFVEYIDEQVAASDIVLVVIGRHWLSATDKYGRRRLDNPEDFVRVEIEAALKQQKHVVPILVHGAPMPISTELPEKMQPLARRNAFFTTPTGFKAETGRLSASLQKTLAMLDEKRVAAAAAERAEQALLAEREAREAAERERLKRWEVERVEAARQAEKQAQKAAEGERLRRQRDEATQRAEWTEVEARGAAGPTPQKAARRRRDDGAAHNAGPLPDRSITVQREQGAERAGSAPGRDIIAPADVIAADELEKMTLAGLGRVLVDGGSSTPPIAGDAQRSAAASEPDATAFDDHKDAVTGIHLAEEIGSTPPLRSPASQRSMAKPRWYPGAFTIIAMILALMAAFLWIGGYDIVSAMIYSFLATAAFIVLHIAVDGLRSR
jgi:hypothetical protein